LFGPSLPVHVQKGTMASADFWQFSHTSLYGLLYLNTHPQHTCQTSPGKSDSLHPIYPPHLPVWGSGSVGLRACLADSSTPLQPYMRFLFIGPGLCLRLPSDSTSRWTPLPSANGSHCQAHSGLSPPSYRPCRAHQKKATTLWCCFLPSIRTQARAN
jgi:hypothetical protein